MGYETVTLYGGPLDGYAVKLLPNSARTELVVKQPVYEHAEEAVTAANPTGIVMVGERKLLYRRPAGGKFEFVAEVF